MRKGESRVKLLAAALVSWVGLYPSAFAAALATTEAPEVREEVPVTSNYVAAPRANNSPALAVDPAEPRFVVLASRLDAPDFGCALHLSGDGGRGWVPANPVATRPPGMQKCYAPEVAFDDAGNLFFLFVGLAGEGNEPMGVYLTRSPDRGRTFDAPRKVLGAFSYMVRMAIDNQNAIHLVWLKASSDPALGSLPPPPNPLLATRSEDAGLTWSRPAQVNDPARQRVVAPALALGPDGSVHVAYYDLRDDLRDYHGLEGPTWEGTWQLLLATSRDGGRSYAHRAVIDDGVVPTERVMLIFTMPPASLAADDSGRLFAAWPDNRMGDADVLLKRSSDGGASWGRPVRVNRDEVGNGRDQYLPKLFIAPGGRVDAVFYDNRDSRPNAERDVTYAFSETGKSFGHDYSLTSKPSDSGIGPRYAGPAAVGAVEHGSRLGLASSDASVLAAWSDTRNAQGPPLQDIFASRIDFFGPDEPGPGRAPWKSLAVLIIGLCVLLIILRLAKRREGEGAHGPGPVRGDASADARREQ